jgi:hypothetical protein
MALYSSFVRSIQSFVCLAEPEAGAGSHHDPKTSPDVPADLTAVADAAPAAENAAQEEGGISAHAIRSAPSSGASIHPVG